MLHKVRWTPEKIGSRIDLIEPLVYRRKEPLPPFRYKTLESSTSDPVLGANIDDWQVIEPDSHWGRRYTNFMLSSTFTVPTEWTDDLPVALYLPLGDAGDFSHPEALAYIDGESYAACDRHHQEILLPDRWRNGASHRLDLHGWTGLIGFRHGKADPGLFMRPCYVVQIDQSLRNFVASARVALGVAEQLDPNHPARGSLLNALDAAFKQVDLREPLGDGFYSSILAAHEVLKDGIGRAGPSLQVDVIATGHAHIDVAWLWTLGQTRRKSGRTFHTVLRLMEQFPDYHFTQSQPQLYDYVRQDYPDLYDGIKKHIEDDRWEVIGGMWVEADCNLSGGESLARQFLLGCSFFRQEFGEDVASPVLWLPDVFGYAWNLPQLIKEAGLEYFFTIKIGWSQYNRLPYDSFWWQGLDGTKVLTHFSTTPSESAYASTYNAKATPDQALGTWTNFQQQEQQNELLMAFGYGDGGGGPTREMLENIREMGDFPATPRMRQAPVKEFFQNMENECGDQLPTWNGELYLELHRGTYTTQGRNKRANRRSEFLLHDAEFLASLATLVDPAYTYPTGDLREAWELVCLNQFHDIIPGSSIKPVYTESLAQYEQIRQIGEQARNEALSAISGQFSGELLAVNPTSFARSDLGFWPGRLDEGQTLQNTDGTSLEIQPTEDGTLVDLGEVPPYSVSPLQVGLAQETAPTNDTLTASPTHLENDFLRVELNEAGDIVRVFDKDNEREVLPTGAIANQFQAFEDRPLNWDAWDIDIFYDDKMYLSKPAQSVKVVEDGPLRVSLEVKRQILKSSYTQRISLSHNSPRLDFDTHIDWQERHILLKVAFPADVLSPKATYEIQWGNVERPTHRNTSWDWARFETCAQKWVDLSEGDYGISVLNDGKYGHDVRDNVIRISLLRSPTHPDPEADRGEHRFAYSLYPHSGGWNEQTVREAYALNDPLLIWDKGRSSPVSDVQNERGPSGRGPVIAEASTPLISVDQPNVVVETVKRAEDGDGLIVRLYENQRRRGQVTLTAGFDVAGAERTNLLEDTAETLDVYGRNVIVNVRPYQIVTLRLRPE